MQAVQNFARITKQIDELMRELERAYTSGGVPGVKEAYFSDQKKLLESGYSLEKIFTEFYYRFLSEHKKNTADLIDYLSISVSECPASIDLNYLLALQLESDGQVDEAKQQYKRCLELNPAHHYARMKLELMELEKSNYQDN